MGPFSVVRWVRAASFAATCAALAVLGHLAGGGSFDPASASQGFLLLLLPALALTGRERSLSSILPATALSQVILHVLLTRNTDRPTMAHHVHTPGMDMSQLDHAGSTSSGMLLMHATAVLLTSVWLRWVEAGLCALVRQLAGWVLRPLLVLLLMAAGCASREQHATVCAGEDEAACIRLFLRHALVRRGPPGRRAGTALAA
ncbi:hypothetical protein OHA25_50405 [Nonomuraea sp. NBC_00507]|uniref:hypothetical protein n=1 Tax=Nonomuraea sp. NBC_00507 TaxID=2976002 RepID=UPI002E1856E2